VHKVILGIGTNIGDRFFFLQRAVNLIVKDKLISNVNVSSIYESKALLPDDAPQDWEKDFLNMAICGFCKLQPLDLLKKIKLIEKTIGRKDRGFWSPREIDIDILAFGDVVTVSQKLTIPHSEFLRRNFAFLPAAEIYPEWIYPKNDLFFQKTLEEIISEVSINCDNIKKTNYKITL